MSRTFHEPSAPPRGNGYPRAVEDFQLSAALGAFIFAVAIVALVTAVRRAATLCVVEVRNGVVSVKRGQLAPRIVADLGDIARRPKVVQGRIEIRREGKLAVVHVKGPFSDAQRQQIRNVVGSVPLARLRSGGRPR